MPFVHIANICFEQELEDTTSTSLLLLSSSIYRQLQFIPLLYANENDFIITWDKAPLEYISYLQTLGLGTSSLRLYSDPTPYPHYTLSSWGITPEIQTWAIDHKLQGNLPDPLLVKTLHSKEFSFQMGKPLPYSRLLKEDKDIPLFLKETPLPFVLKTTLGFSGKGHLIISNSSPESLKKIYSFCQKEFVLNRSVIAEPWLKRIQDFSSQWEITSDGKVHYLGATLCINDIKGHYLGSKVGDPKELFFSYESQLEEHLAFVEAKVEWIARKGYFGILGIDAFLYLDNKDQLLLHPLVEINIRKTMGTVALLLHRKQKSSSITHIYLAAKPHNPTDIPLLPWKIIQDQDPPLYFKKNLFLNLN